MEIGITDYYINTYGLDEGAKKMEKHGYSFIDLQFTNTNTEYYTAREENFLSLILGVKRTLAKHGISVNQIHGPCCTPRLDSTEDERAELFGKMAKALVIAKHLGAKFMVVHPLMPYGVNSDENPNEVYEINKRYFSALANVAHGLGVTVCLENMPFEKFPLSRSESILTLVKDIDHPCLKMCFDTGHAILLGEDLWDSVRLIDRDNLKAIHVHDNLGDSDAHLAPYDGIIDWSSFAEGLYDIGFDGVFSLETAPVLNKEINDGLSNEEIEAKELALAKIAKLIAG